MKVDKTDFVGSLVVITGGTGGIGWRCAELFSKRGATVIACSHDAQQTAQATSRAEPGIHVRTVDVRSEASIAKFFEAEPLIVNGGVDVVVNCAGLQILGTTEQTSLEAWNEVMQVNVTGAFLVSKFALPAMRRRGGGSIVNVSSIHARVTGQRRVAYTTSKTALIGLTRAMSLDHAFENIRVNAVLPGTIDTQMLRHAWAELRPDKTAEQMSDLVQSVNPISRLGVPQDIANAVVFLSSSDASFITGVELVVDGGVVNKIALPVTQRAD
jgi:NAD(P)-dependent dehydrogenase (short-subunit alcohol dehydrogenase family)